MEYFIFWRVFWKDKEWPIIECDAEYEERESLKIIIPKAFRLIIKAREFKGILYSDPPVKDKQEMDFRLSFTLLFPSENYANEYLKYLSKLDYF